MDSDAAASTGSAQRTPRPPQPTRSTTEILELVDPSSLSPETRETIQLAGSMLASEYPRSRIARDLGVTEETLTQRLDAVRVELAEQALEHADEPGPALQERLRAELEASRRRLGRPPD